MDTFQIRTEDIFGEEGCETYNDRQKAIERYDQLRLMCYDDEENTLEHIELIEVLEQHRLPIGKDAVYP